MTPVRQKHFIQAPFPETCAFLHETYAADPEERVTHVEIYARYLRWCLGNDADAVESSVLSAVIAREFPEVQRGRTKGFRVWKGLRARC